MSTERKKLLHLRSSQLNEDGTPKLPTADQLEYGEIAVNFTDGNETLSIKNSNNEIATFTNDAASVDAEEVVAQGFGKVKEILGIEGDELTYEAATDDTILGKATSYADADNKLSTAVQKVYTKSEVDALFEKLIQLNSTLVWE